jgi:hypothetical protein
MNELSIMRRLDVTHGSADTWWFIATLIVLFGFFGVAGGIIGGSAVLGSELYAAFMNPWTPNEWNKRELLATGIAGGVVTGYLLMWASCHYRRRALPLISLLMLVLPLAIVAGGLFVFALLVLSHVT